MCNPFISVALPVYNGQEYLSEAIESILHQTFKNFELIIIDDGSTDESLKILEKYQKLDARIRLISRENRNLPATLNQIVGLANGEWIARMDQDDIALPNRFQAQIDWLAQTRVDIVGSWVKQIGSTSGRTIYFYENDDEIKVDMLFRCPLAHSAVMMRTALIRDLQYNSDQNKAEDYDLWSRAAQFGYRFGNVPEVLLMYRVHEAQMSNVSSEEQQKLTLDIQESYWKFYFDRLNLDKSNILLILRSLNLINKNHNLNVLSQVMTRLAMASSMQAKQAIFRNTTNFFFKVAGASNGALKEWLSFCRSIGVRPPLWDWLRIFTLSNMGISFSDVAFKKLKRIYFLIFRH